MQKENFLNLGVSTVGELEAAYNKYPDQLTKDYQAVFNHPRFRTRETGVSRRDISVWKKQGLLPNNNTDETSWNEFSLIECIWLRLVAKLKKFGMDNKFILDFKEIAFSQKADDYRNIYRLNPDNSVYDHGSDNIYQKAQQKLEHMSDEELESVLKDINFSFFGTMIMPACIMKMNMVVFFFEDDISLLNLSTASNEIHKANLTKVLSQLTTRTCVTINLKELCFDFFDNEQLHIDNDYYWGLMNFGERRVLNEIRSSKVKQVTIKIKDGSITHIKPMREDKENEAMIRKLSRLMKKGEYKQIELITRDGNIVKYDETDIIKMK